MTTIAIVQARMGSTRLPGKVMIDLGGKSVLQRVTERLQRADLLDQVMVATTTEDPDQAIVEECDRLGVAIFRGSEKDVLDRYYQAVLQTGATTVVRITADCPLIDPVVVDQTIRVFVEAKADYANNVTPRTYPRGLDVEVMTAAALERAWREAHLPHEREHVTPYLYEHPGLFQLAFHSGASDYSRYRWTLDTPEDLELLKRLYLRLGNRDDFFWDEASALMEKDPKLAELNAAIIQKSMHPH